MPSASPLITVGILCYNAENTIARAIESALEQDWDNKEILVVDDGSTDRSVEIVKSLAAKQSIIRLVQHEKNAGCPAARNTVLQEARGDYLAFFDDDDWSYPNRLTEQFDRLSSYGCDSDIVLCFCNREVVRIGQSGVVPGMKGMGYGPKEPNGEMLARYILFHDFGQLNGEALPGYTWGASGTGTLMLSRKSWERVGLFDSTLRRGEDLDYVIRAGLDGGYCISADKILLRQYKSFGDDKSNKIISRSQLQCWKKYRTIFATENVGVYMWLAVHGSYHERKGSKWAFKLYRSLAKRWLGLLRLFGLTSHTTGKQSANRREL